MENNIYDRENENGTGYSEGTEQAAGTSTVNYAEGTEPTNGADATGYTGNAEPEQGYKATVDNNIYSEQGNNVNSDGFYHYSKNQNNFYDNPYYSSSRHAGYNSQTGYTSAYTGMNNPSGDMNNNGYYSQPNPNEYANMNQEKTEKEYKKETEKSEKLIKKAKKKAEKKARKESKKSGNGGRSAGRRIGFVIASAVIFGLVAGIVFQGVRYGSDYFLDNDDEEVASTASSSDSSSSTVTTTSSTVSTVYDVAAVAEKVMPSIVSITGTYVTTYQYWYETYEEEASGAGSGIIIGQDDDNLFILTNYHVVEDSTELSVGFVDGESADATIKGYDSANDIAIVIVSLSDISNNTMSEISEITLGSSEDLSVGDPCVAIGNALGYGQSVTVGYVSALDREISVDDGTITVLQTDAAINPGNSGGALVNMNGELIGVNTAKYVDSEVEGMGYAIPISNVLDVIEDLLEGNTTGNAYLGVSVQDITEEYAQGLNMPEGVYVYSVTEDSPAEACGLVTGDIIVEIDGEEVLDGSTLQEKISQHSVGDEIEITFYRNENGQYVKKTVTAVLELKS